MKETLKMMRTIIEDKKECTLEELLQSYKQNQNSYTIAYLFVNNFGLFTMMANKYTLLDEQDIISYGLQELDKAIMQYDINANCKFSTFFMTYFNKRLLAEQHSLLYNKRKANYFTEDLDILQDTPADDYTYFDLDEYNLTNQEKTHAELLISRIFCKRVGSFF